MDEESPLVEGEGETDQEETASVVIGHFERPANLTAASGYGRRFVIGALVLLAIVGYTLFLQIHDPDGKVESLDATVLRKHVLRLVALVSTTPPPSARQPAVSVGGSVKNSMIGKTINAPNAHIESHREVMKIYEASDPSATNYSATRELEETLTACMGPLCDGHFFRETDKHPCNTPHIKELIEVGANPNTVSNEACSALFAAINMNDVNLVRAMLSRGAEPDWPNGQWNSRPLMRASYLGHRGVMNYLLAFKANVNQVDKHGFSAVEFALAGDHPELARLLIDQGGQCLPASSKFCRNHRRLISR